MIATKDAPAATWTMRGAGSWSWRPAKSGTASCTSAAATPTNEGSPGMTTLEIGPTKG